MSTKINVEHVEGAVLGEEAVSEVNALVVELNRVATKDSNLPENIRKITIERE